MMRGSPTTRGRCNGFQYAELCELIYESENAEFDTDTGFIKHVQLGTTLGQIFLHWKTWPKMFLDHNIALRFRNTYHRMTECLDISNPTSRLAFTIARA